MAGLREVAQAAGVSVPTASRVLSGADYPVADDLRKRVLRAAEHLDYVPNRQAQALLGGNTGTVGILVGDIGDPYFSAIVRGVYDVATAERLMVTVCSTERDVERELDYFKLLQANRTEFVILAGSGLLEERYRVRLDARAESFRRSGGNLVSVGDPTNYNARVLVDNVEGGRMLGEHLVGLGHAEIAVLAGDPRVVSTVDRIAGLREGFPGLMHVSHGIPTRKNASEMAHRALDEHPHITAIVGSADQFALGALAAMRARRLTAPEDLSVAGFNDIAAADDVELTSVSLPLRAMGAAAMRLGLRSRHTEDPGEKRFRTTLIQRRTTGPARPKGR